MKIGAIIQARMASTRLPGKVMKRISDKTVLRHVIERIQQCRMINEIIVATTVNETDDVIEKEAIAAGAKVFRGSEQDVLSRYYYAAKENNLDAIIRITSDCPLIDPQVIDAMLDVYVRGEYEFVTNGGAELSLRTFPRGLDTEIFSFACLEEAFIKAAEPYQREHVTPYIYENCGKIYNYKNGTDYSQYRVTLDTEEDFTLISAVYSYLYKDAAMFYLNDIIGLFQKNPELIKINSHIEQKKLTE